MAKQSETRENVTNAVWFRSLGRGTPALVRIAKDRLFSDEMLHWSPHGHWEVVWVNAASARPNPVVVASGRHDGDVFEAFEALYADRLALFFGIEVGRD